MYFSLFLIAVGLLLDVYQFSIFLYKIIQRQRTPSFGPLLGFLLVFIGLWWLKLDVPSFTWTLFVVASIGAAMFHLLFIIVLPHLATRFMRTDVLDGEHLRRENKD